MLSTYSDLYLTSGNISTVNRNQQNYPTMDLPVELVGILRHAEIDGKKLTWDIHVNSSAISVKLMWINVEKPVEKTGQVTSQAQKKKHISPSTRKRNAQRINQWKAKKNEAVGDSKTCAQTQTFHNRRNYTNRAATRRQPSPPQTNNIDTNKEAIDPSKK